MTNAYIISKDSYNYLYIDNHKSGFQYAIYYYLNNEKVKVLWYQSSNIIKLVDYSEAITLKVFIRDSTDTLVEQFYVEKQSLDKNKVISLVKDQLALTPIVKNIYTAEDEYNYKQMIGLLWALSLLEPDGTSYLLKICSLVKSWNKVFNDETLLASSEVLKRNERTDAVIYFCLSIISTSTWENGKKLIENVQGILEDPNNINICDIFIALYEFENEEFDGYCNHINKVIENRDDSFEHYIFTPVKTVYTINRKTPISVHQIKNNIFSNKIVVKNTSPNMNYDYIISLSCNQKYFDLYSRYILDTLKEHCNNFKVIIFASDGEESYYKSKLQNYQNVDIYLFKGLPEINLKPISSILRYYYVYDILQEYKLPVFVFDLDSVVFKDLFDFISLCENFDISSRILRRGVLPWEKYTGGFTVFNMKPLSIQLALEIKFISEQLLKADEVQWWIDQNVIEAAIRQIKYQGNSIKIHNAMSVRDDFIKMPVGNTETKKYLLDNLYSKSLNNSTIEGL